LQYPSKANEEGGISQCYPELTPYRLISSHNSLIINSLRHKADNRFTKSILESYYSVYLVTVEINTPIKLYNIVGIEQYH